MDDDGVLENLSKVFYKNAVKTIGSEEMITDRRIIMKISEELRDIEAKKRCGNLHHRIGSRSEGFRIYNSHDQTAVVSQHITVQTGSNVDSQTLSHETVLMMEADQTRPGFCFLRLVQRPEVTDSNLRDSVVEHGNNLYISSALWRDPNGELYLRCNKWPSSALPCIRRLARIGWPSDTVLSSIVHKACGFEPIGDTTSDNESLEWRISFWEAEKVLVQEMNYCQFLCYGLLKIFLSEVISRLDVDELISSYVLKTTILWEIVYNRTPWVKKDFLKLTWNCFRRLLSWVSNGYCPNFFIPENDMFYGKLNRRSQQVLLHNLTSLYNEGYHCLPCCQCMPCKIVLFHPHLYSFASPEVEALKIGVDVNLILELDAFLSSSDDISILHGRISLLENIEPQNQMSSESLIRDVFLSFDIQYYLFCKGLKLCRHLTAACNKQVYKLVCKFVNSLKRSKIDISTHNILSAMFLYKLEMYGHVVRIATNVIDRIQRPQVMYRSNLSLEYYRMTGGEYSHANVIMRKFFVRTLSLGKSMRLSELSLEHQCFDGNLEYPPIVFLNLLLNLSYHHLSMYSEADSVLRDLTELIYTDNDHHIPRRLRAISWEILGICQEMGGYLNDACMSYQKALGEPNTTTFCDATLFRIQNLTAILNSL